MTHHPYQVPETAARAWHWRDDAACQGRGPLFLPGIDHGPAYLASTAAAKGVCASCPVRITCLDDAMATEGGGDERARAGVRGGLTPKDRAGRYRRQLRGAAEPRTLLDQYLRRTEALDGGHVRWTVNTTYIVQEGRKYTGAQLAWALATNRKPEGLLRAACGLAGCVAAEHLTDEVMRDARNRYRSWKTAA